MKIGKKTLQFFLMFLLLMFTLSPIQTFAGSTGQSYQYVSLGDSLAAGFLNDSEPPDYNVGDGYPEFIKQGIEDNTDYQVNLNNAGVGGYTTSDVLTQLKSNPNNLRENLAEADLITLDIGANDLLAAIDIENLDPDELDQVINDLDEVMNQVRGNLDAILGEVRDINPEASIYVMGYYNALHYVDTELQDMIGFVLNNMLNKEIQNASAENNASYVPTFDNFEGEYDTYLPNPDIHPNEAGYQVIGDVFLEDILPALPATPLEEVNQASDVETMQSALENEDLEINLEDYNTLSKDEQAEAAGMVFDSGGFADTNALQAAVNDAVDEVTGPSDEDQGGQDDQDGEDGQDGDDGQDGQNGEDEDDSQDSGDSQNGEDHKTGDANNEKDNNDDDDTNTDSNNDDPNGTVESGDDNEIDGGTLPATTTNNPLLVLIGSLMTVAGGAVVFIREKIMA